MNQSMLKVVKWENISDLQEKQKVNTEPLYTGQMQFKLRAKLQLRAKYVLLDQYNCWSGVML